MDLSQYSEEQLFEIRNTFSFSALLTQKYSKYPGILAKKLAQILAHFEEDATKGSWTILSKYVFYLVELEPKEFVTLLERLPQSSNTGIMSLYEKILKLGREEGITKGIEQGREEGIDKTKHETAIRGYENGLPIAMISNITGLSEEEVKRIIAQLGK